MEFDEKQYDGPYEVTAIEINIEEQLLRGLLYFPRDLYSKPFPVITYFHDFPQIFSLHQIIVNLEFLLKNGFSLLVFNFRGYGQSQGQVSLQSQLQDAVKIAEFVQSMGEKGIFKRQELNILSHGFGCYFALLLCSTVNIVNNVLLLSPILDVKNKVSNHAFVNLLQYLNRYLPGIVHGIENVDNFISKTKLELNNDRYQVEKVLNDMKFNKLKIIVGNDNKFIDISQLKATLVNYLVNTELVLVEQMEHEWIEEDCISEIQEQILSFFCKY